MYRELADHPKPENKKSWRTPTLEEVNRAVFGVGGVTMILCSVFYVIGLVLHIVMVPNEKIAHVDPLVVRICWRGAEVSGFLFGLTLLYAAGFGCRWFVLVAMGKEKL